MTGIEFKDIREGAGLSLRDVAAKLRMSDITTIRRFESGEKPASGPVSVIMEWIRDGRF